MKEDIPDPQTARGCTLQLPATVWAVTRRERSVVALKKSGDPVARYLDDARAMARTQQLPEQVRAVAVAGLCREALEAACFEAVRCRQLGAGVPHAGVERALESAHTLHHAVALALSGDTDHGNEVVTKVRELGGQPCVNAFRFAKRGVHETQHGQLKRLVEDTEKLTKAPRRWVLIYSLMSPLEQPHPHSDRAGGFALRATTQSSSTAGPSSPI